MSTPHISFRVVAVLSALLVSSMLLPAVKSSSAAVDKETRKRQRQEIDQLMGKFTWGMPSNKVLAILGAELDAVYAPKLKEKVGDAVAYDRLHQELVNKKAELTKSRVGFLGQQSPWDVSLVEKEFAHRNHESMIVSWADRDRRFFFFHHDRLYKIYIAFNAEMFQDKTFEDFAAIMEVRFGPAEQKFVTNLKGERVADHLIWPKLDDTLLRAIDNTEFYGTFCLVLTNSRTELQVMAGRKNLTPTELSTDTLVDVVTQKENKDNKVVAADPNEDVIDRITGNKSITPEEQDTVTSPEPPAEAEKPAKKPKSSAQRGKNDNPLRDVDL